MTFPEIPKKIGKLYGVLRDLWVVRLSDFPKGIDQYHNSRECKSDAEEGNIIDVGIPIFIADIGSIISE